MKQKLEAIQHCWERGQANDALQIAQEIYQHNPDDPLILLTYANALLAVSQDGLAEAERFMGQASDLAKIYNVFIKSKYEEFFCRETANQDYESLEPMDLAHRYRVQLDRPDHENEVKICWEQILYTSRLQDICSNSMTWLDYIKAIQAANLFDVTEKIKKIREIAEKYKDFAENDINVCTVLAEDDIANGRFSQAEASLLKLLTQHPSNGFVQRAYFSSLFIQPKKRTSAWAWLANIAVQPHCDHELKLALKVHREREPISKNFVTQYHYGTIVGYLTATCVSTKIVQHYLGNIAAATTVAIAGVLGYQYWHRAYSYLFNLNTGLPPLEAEATPQPAQLDQPAVAHRGRVGPPVAPRARLITSWNSGHRVSDILALENGRFLSANGDFVTLWALNSNDITRPKQNWQAKFCEKLTRIGHYIIPTERSDFSAYIDLREKNPIDLIGIKKTSTKPGLIGKHIGLFSSRAHCDSYQDNYIITAPSSDGRAYFSIWNLDTTDMEHAQPVQGANSCFFKFQSLKGDYLFSIVHGRNEASLWKVNKQNGAFADITYEKPLKNLPLAIGPDGKTCFQDNNIVYLGPVGAHDRYAMMKELGGEARCNNSIQIFNTDSVSQTPEEKPVPYLKNLFDLDQTTFLTVKQAHGKSSNIEFTIWNKSNITVHKKIVWDYGYDSHVHLSVGRLSNLVHSVIKTETNHLVVSTLIGVFAWKIDSGVKTKISGAKEAGGVCLRRKAPCIAALPNGRLVIGYPYATAPNANFAVYSLI